MVQILGINLYDLDIRTSAKDVLDKIISENKLNRCISATGAHGIIHATKNPEFKRILNSFYLNLPDGMPAVWIGRLKGAKQMQRCYGPDFFEELMRVSAKRPIKHFFCGGKEGVADELKRQCEHKFNNHNVVGTFCPPFRQMSDDELACLGARINQSEADIVWIGLSTPKQEKFAWQLKQYVSTHSIITVGAAFDFHTNRLKQAPSWIQNMGMEWFFRLLNEPKRLYRRYMKIVPLFIYYNLLELISSRFFKK